MTHGVYLLYRLFKDSSTKSYGEEKPNRYWLSVIFWAKLMQNEPRLDVVADQTRLVRRLGV
jgi:hypothetical protein